MSKSKFDLRYLLGIGIAVLAVVFTIVLLRDKLGTPEDPPDPDPATNAPPIRTLQREPLEPEATKRLADGPQDITTVSEVTGKGDYAKHGASVKGSFYYITTVQATSEITSKKETALGNIQVVERRTFKQVKDFLQVSDPDLSLALDTLPVGQVSEFVQSATVCFGLIFKVNALTVNMLIESAKQQLKLLDGTSVRGLFGKFDVNIPQNVDAFLNKYFTGLANNSSDDIRKLMQSIEGKTFIITYLQNKQGAPLEVSFKNQNNSPISDAEWEILRLANVFIDSDIIPDKRFKVGDTWDRDAEDIATLLEPVAGQNCRGELKLTREADNANGDWNVSIAPGKITTFDNSGTTSGTVDIKKGSAIADGNHAFIKELQLVGSGGLKILKSERHFLLFDFFTRITGECDFRVTMATKRL